ncbi:MAG TPA: tRNA epoxyqueuosine(34) reductase QueG [Vicinamibacteria bacterium]|nr:tRNA epoxyqueuosine(34) reductase QueG [Vicinamibacteria bacterium]
MDEVSLAARARAIALEVGFDLAGVAGAEAPHELAFFAEWVARGFAGEMSYLLSQVERRSDLRVAFPWARSLLCVALQYDTPHPYSTAAASDPARGWLSRYAWGDDYHEVMKAMLERLAARLQAEAGPCRTRVYVDTGPIVERAYAAAAGLGAWGKNTCLLHPEHGSWFFLGEVVTDLDLAKDAPRADMCGSCTACLEACPTGALAAPYQLDATRCISYLTIEVKGAVSEEMRPGLGRHIFGCDICQDVCPWNRRRRHRGGAAFEPRPGALAPALAELARLDEEGFRARFRRSPLRRAKRRGLLRNVSVALGNSGEAAHRPLLERLAQDEDAVVREHAAWALRRLDGAAAAETGPRR